MTTDDIRGLAPLASRDRILGLLRHGARTVEELATAVDLTANAVRAQLVGLERDGLVRREQIRYTESAGKPPWTFAITPEAEAGFSRAYQPALTALAETLTDTLEPRDLRRLYERTGKRLAAAIPASKGKPAPEMARAVLASLGAAVVLDTTVVPAIVAGAACPLAATVRKSPGSCEIVRSMLAGATNARVTTRCDHGELPRCRFAID